MKSVILDSNALRGLGGKRLDSFLEAEARAGVLQLQDSWTLFELISHLVSPDDKGYRSSLFAIKAAARRSFLRPQPQLLLPAESLVALMIFGENPPGLAGSLSYLIECCEDIAQIPDGKSLEPLQSRIEEIARSVVRMEELFANQIESLSATLLGVTEHHLGKPDRGTIRRFLRSELRRLDAVALITRAYTQFGKSVPASISDALVEAVARKCAAGTAVLTEAFVRVMCDGANLNSSRTRNLLWDQEIAFPVGQQVQEGTLHLVTDDKIFRSSLAHVEMEDFVQPLDAYLQEIGVTNAA